MGTKNARPEHEWEAKESKLSVQYGKIAQEPQMVQTKLKFIHKVKELIYKNMIQEVSQ